MKPHSTFEDTRQSERGQGSPLWVAVPGLLAVGAVAAALSGLRTSPAVVNAVGAGAAAAAACAIAGLLMAGTGTAGLLLLRAYGRLRGLGISDLSPGRHGWVAGRSLAESAGLGLAAVLPGLFLLAFVKLVAEDNHQGVVFPVLTDAVVLDGRALVLAFVVITGMALLFGARAVLEATRNSLALALARRGGAPAGSAAAAAAKPGCLARCATESWNLLRSSARALRTAGMPHLAAVIVPVGVSVALLAGTTIGVRRVVSMVWIEKEVDRGSAMVLEDKPAPSGGTSTNVPPTLSMLEALLHS